MENHNQGEVNVYALVKAGIVMNTIMWNGDGKGWSPPPGQEPVRVEANDGPVSIGWTYDGNRFIQPD